MKTFLETFYPSSQKKGPDNRALYQSLITSLTSLTVRMRDTSLSYCSLPEMFTVMKILAV